MITSNSTFHDLLISNFFVFLKEGVEIFFLVSFEMILFKPSSCRNMNAFKNNIKYRQTSFNLQILIFLSHINFNLTDFDLKWVWDKSLPLYVCFIAL